MKLSDVPPEAARDFLWAALERNGSREDGSWWRVQLHMSVEEARLFWYADRHLDVYQTMGVGIETTDFTLAQVRKFLAEIIGKAKAQAGAEEIVIEFLPRELAILADAATHLDRFCISSKFESRPTQQQKQGRRR